MLVTLRIYEVGIIYHAFEYYVGTFVKVRHFYVFEPHIYYGSLNNIPSRFIILSQLFESFVNVVLYVEAMMTACYIKNKI